MFKSQRLHSEFRQTVLRCTRTIVDNDTAVFSLLTMTQQNYNYSKMQFNRSIALLHHVHYKLRASRRESLRDTHTHTHVHWQTIVIKSITVIKSIQKSMCYNEIHCKMKHSTTKTKLPSLSSLSSLSSSLSTTTAAMIQAAQPVVSASANSHDSTITVIPVNISASAK